MNRFLFKLSVLGGVLFLAFLIFSNYEVTKIIGKLHNAAAKQIETESGNHANETDIVHDYFEQQILIEEEAYEDVLETKIVLEKVKNITRCFDRPMVSRIGQRGNYWVLYNYVRAEKSFQCHESITYTTHGDFSFMDNLVPLLQRWKGPISVALFAPGTDFDNTLNTIAYLRDCTSPLVKQLVTFHIYFGVKHIPSRIPKSTDFFEEKYNCALPAPYQGVSSSQTYKSRNKLLYPINVGRNIARETTQTHFVFASDIELYPSPNIIPQFLKMISRNKGPLLSKNPKVFPLHLFEVSGDSKVPENKTVLLRMLANGKAVPFHKKVCEKCHQIPNAVEWQAQGETKGLHVFSIGKRNEKFVYWEPIYIGTHADPLYDERLSWEGEKDKRTQGYVFCVMDYDFLVLDNAFLVHKPGIKTFRPNRARAVWINKTNRLIHNTILPELKILYGYREGCDV